MNVLYFAFALLEAVAYGKHPWKPRPEPGWADRVFGVVGAVSILVLVFIPAWCLAQIFADDEV